MASTWTRGLLPQEHVVGEVHAVTGGKAHLGNRHQTALDLAAFDCPNWMRAMSAIEGSSVQPEAVVRSWMLTGAPQVGQLVSAPVEVCLQ